MDKRDYVFVSRIQMLQNPYAVERLKTITRNIHRDENSQGMWIKRNSTAHSLAALLGIQVYDYDLTESGTWDRHGRVR